MPLSNIDVNRVLTNEEVKMMLAEDVIEEDTEIAQTMKHWKYHLKRCWRSRAFCDKATHKVQVNAWKEEQTYVFQATDKQQICKSSLCGKVYGYRCITEMSYLTAMPRKSQIEGISIAEIEKISAKFYLPDAPIKCLLDAGFTLKLIVPREFLGI